jgi:hypothetical protein
VWCHPPETKNPGRLPGLYFFVLTISSDHKTPVQNGPVLIPIVGITPISELLNLLSYQYSDSFSQLFFKEPRVKTYSGEYIFDIVEHFHSFFKIRGSKLKR